MLATWEDQIGPSVAILILAVAYGIRSWVDSRKVDQVASTLADKTAADKVRHDETATALSKIDATGERNHILLNSERGALLKLYAVAMRRLADGSHLPADIEAASTAERLLADHQEKQSVVDAKNEQLVPRMPLGGRPEK